MQEKVLKKFSSHLWLKKTFPKMGIDRTYLNIIKAIYGKRREVESKEEGEKYIQLNAELQKIIRRDYN